MNLQKQSRRYDVLRSWLESRLLRALEAGTVKVADQKYWKYSDLIDKSNNRACQFDELYSLND